MVDPNPDIIPPCFELEHLMLLFVASEIFVEVCGDLDGLLLP